MSRNRLAIVYGLIVCGVLFALFHFSGQNTEVSNGLSGMLAAKVFSLFRYAYTAQELDALNLLLRKMAHFTLFFLLGFGLTGTIRSFVRGHPLLAAILMGLLFAVMDESHQYFVQGRNASIGDVLLDSCGVAVGGLVCCGLARLWRLYQTRVGKHTE